MSSRSQTDLALQGLIGRQQFVVSRVILPVPSLWQSKLSCDDAPHELCGRQLPVVSSHRAVIFLHEQVPELGSSQLAHLRDCIQRNTHSGSQVRMNRDARRKNIE